MSHRETDALYKCKIRDNDPYTYIILPHVFKYFKFWRPLFKFKISFKFIRDGSIIVRELKHELKIWLIDMAISRKF